MVAPKQRLTYFRRLRFDFPVMVFVLALMSDACADDKLQFFETHIRPVLVEKCYECHSAEAKKSQGELSLDSREGLLLGGTSGAAIVPGEPAESPLLSALRHESFEMPPSGKLPDEVIAKFEQWIRDGAVDPREATQPAVGLAKVNWDEARDYWAFRPVQHPAVPEVSSDRPRGPIDAFVWSQLQSANLDPNAEVARTTWLRRVTFDLIGLPPSPEQIEAFVADERSDAFERVVDRLLASPRYGERHGRHWLDLARYADSNGADENHEYPVAWRFRDYVVDAYNVDLPYDRFVIEQLAGDLLPADSDAERARLLTATGMLVIGPKMLAEQDKPKLVADLVDEQLDTVGKVFLGLTLGCARCHDHKFDPIKAADYYALAGIFHSTKSMEHLQFVSQWNERELPNAIRSQEIAAHRKQIEVARADIQQLVITAQRPLFDTQWNGLAAGLKWRSLDHQPSAEELQPLGLTESQTERLVRFAALSTWRDLTSIESLGEGLRSLVKTPVESPTPEQIQAAVLAAFLAAWTEVTGSERDEKGALKDERLIRLDHQLYGDQGPFERNGKWELSLTDEVKERLAKLREGLAALEKSQPALDKAMAADEDAVKLVSIHARGNHLQMQGEPLPRSVPEILKATTPEVIFPTDHSGRLEFANWLTSPTHPLTARVMVNRLWQFHFSEGIVRSASNFGLRGDLPTHPELLDYLATEFIRQNWSQKAMHRQIVLSSVYRLGSSGQEQGNKADPDNRMLWHMNRHRLEIEPLRDALWTVADELDTQTGGRAQAIYGGTFEDTQEPKTIHDASRRTIYLPINRAALQEFFATFDYVDSAVSLEKRPVTTVPHQALFLMNNRLTLHAGWRLAKRLTQYSSDDNERLKFAYAVCFARSPNAEELAAANLFLQQQRANLAAGEGGSKEGAQPIDAALEPWVRLCRSLLLTSEFLYVD